MLVASRWLAGSCALPPDNVFAEAYDLPPEGGWYLAYDDFHLDHWVLYHGLGGSVEKARQAQVLLVGTSRIQFAAPRDALQAFTARTGLRVFSLGFGYGEPSALPLALIERWDLRPKVVVANATSFFRETPTDFGADVMAASAFDANKTVWERRALGVLRHEILGWLPHWSLFSKRSASVVYRSEEDGTWFVRRQNRKPSSVDERAHPGRMVPVTEAEVSAGRAFEAALSARGARLVLAYVPTAEWNAPQREAAQTLANRLGVPLVAPVVQGLTTRDGDHLSEESSARFGLRFLEALEALPEIRALETPATAGTGRAAPASVAGTRRSRS